MEVIGGVILVGDCRSIVWKAVNVGFVLPPRAISVSVFIRQDFQYRQLRIATTRRIYLPIEPIRPELLSF